MTRRAKERGRRRLMNRKGRGVGGRTVHSGSREDPILRPKGQTVGKTAQPMERGGCSKF